MQPLYGLQEITDLMWLGDGKILEFIGIWKQILENNAIQPTTKQLAVILIGKMDGSKILAQDVAYWRHRRGERAEGLRLPSQQHVAPP